MTMCGYHLRCLNYGDRCSECSHQYKDKNNDYLDDVLSLNPENYGAFDADEPAFSQKADTAPFEAVFLNLISSSGSQPATSKPE